MPAFETWATSEFGWSADDFEKWPNGSYKFRDTAAAFRVWKRTK
jgi:hypothetical protein